MIGLIDYKTVKAFTVYNFTANKWVVDSKCIDWKYVNVLRQ